MNKKEREQQYAELNGITGYCLHDECFGSLNLGFPVIAYDTILQGTSKYDHRKSCKDNTALIHGSRARELVIELLKSQ